MENYREQDHVAFSILTGLGASVSNCTVKIAYDWDAEGY